MPDLTDTVHVPVPVMYCTYGTVSGDTDIKIVDLLVVVRRMKYRVYTVCSGCARLLTSILDVQYE